MSWIDDDVIYNRIVITTTPIICVSGVRHSGLLDDPAALHPLITRTADSDQLIIP